MPIRKTLKSTLASLLISLAVCAGVFAAVYASASAGTLPFDTKPLFGAVRVSYFTCVICVIVQAALSVSRDMTSGCAEFLLERTATRARLSAQYLLTDILFALILSALCAAGYIAVGCSLGGTIRDYDLSALCMILFAVLFSSMAVMFSAVSATKTASVCLSLLWFFTSFTAGFLPEITGKLSFLSYFSPYYVAVYANELEYAWATAAAAALLIAVFSAVAYVSVMRKQFPEKRRSER